jgi:hypothetical protein
MSWEKGDVVAWRETWYGQEYIAGPARVAEDDAARLVVYVAQGTELEEEWTPDPTWAVPTLPVDEATDA